MWSLPRRNTMPPCCTTATGSDQRECRERVKAQLEARKSRGPGHLWSVGDYLPLTADKG